jgi:hypothetical protein
MYPKSPSHYFLKLPKSNPSSSAGSTSVTRSDDIPTVVVGVFFSVLSDDFLLIAAAAAELFVPEATKPLLCFTTGSSPNIHAKLL